MSPGCSIDGGSNMAGLIEAIAGTASPQSHRPWPRRLVDADGWAALVAQLAEGRWALAGLWGDHGAVHMALLDAGSGDLAVATLSCPAGSFPSVARHHPPAHRLE